MTVPPDSTPPAIRPTRWWYAVAAAIFVASWIPGIWLSWSGLDTLDFSVRPIVDGTVQVTADEQLSVFEPAYASVNVYSCTVTPTGGGEPIRLERTSNSLTIDGHDRIGFIPEDTTPGSYRLACDPVSATVDEPVRIDDFAVQSTDGWTPAILKIVAAAVTVGFAGLLAITVAVITAVRRSSARRQAIRPQPPYAGPGPYGGYP